MCHAPSAYRLQRGNEDRQHAKERIEESQPLPFFPEAVFDVVHGTAYQVTLLIPLAEMDSQRHLCKFGTHAESGRTPHPEDGSRAADGNRSRHSCDISGSHCSGQSRADCLERRHGTV